MSNELTNATSLHLALSNWIMCREMAAANPASLSGREASERACSKFEKRLALLVTPVGAEALLSRAKRVPRTDFLFVDHQPNAGVEALTQRMRERTNGVSLSQMQDQSSSVLSNLIALVMTFIGEDLTMRLLRDVWPVLHEPEPLLQSSNGHVEAHP